MYLFYKRAKKLWQEQSSAEQRFCLTFWKLLVWLIPESLFYTYLYIFDHRLYFDHRFHYSFTYSFPYSIKICVRFPYSCIIVYYKYEMIYFYFRITDIFLFLYKTFERVFRIQVLIYGALTFSLIIAKSDYLFNYIIMLI